MSSWISTLTNLVAPLAPSQLDTFKQHWFEVKKYYLNEKDDNQSFHESSLPNHFVSLMRLLVDEEAEHGAQFQGPCMELFLKERIFETLCAIGLKDVPVGIRKLIMIVVTDFLNEIKQPILQHNSVHKAVMMLIVASQKCSDDERSALVDLLFAILQRLALQPSLCGFFFGTDAHTFASNAPVFMPVHVLLPLFAASRGAVARRASAALCLALRMHEPGVDAYLIQRAQLSERFVPMLVSQFDAARRAFVSEGASTTSTSTSTTSVASASTSASAAPTSAAVTGDAFRALFAACNDAIATNHTCVASLCSDVQDRLLIASLGPALLSADERNASAVTHLTADALSIATGTLADAMLTLILGEMSDESASSPDSLLLTAIARRVNAKTESCGRASLRLLAALLGTRRREVVATVLVRRLVPRTHMMPSGEQSPRGTTSTSIDANSSRLTPPPSVAAFLQLFPGDRYASDTLYAEYLIDARAHVRAARLAAPAPPAPMTTSHTTITTLPNASTSDAIDVSATDAAAARLSTRDGAFRAGAVVDALFDALAACLRHTVGFNLALTAALAALAHYDDPLLDEYLLDANARLRPGVRSLFGVLRQLSSDVDKRMTATPRLVARLAAARRELHIDTPTSTSADELEEMQFLRAVVVLTEFCKELAAIVQVKKCEPV